MSAGVPIAHFERKYEIYIDGRVWNKGKNCWQAQTQNPNGYMKVVLQLDGVREQLLVHRLVALHFLPNPYGHPFVNHIDGNKTHNAVSNLEWVSREGNAQHALETGLRSGFMSIPEKEEFLTQVLQGEQVSEIAARIGRHPVVLSKMLRKHAEATERGELWTTTMKQRRRDAALRNLQTINSRNPAGG